MKAVVVMVVSWMVWAGGVGLLASTGDRRPDRFHRPLLQSRSVEVVRASRYEARILREIERNRRRMVTLRHENRRLHSRLRHTPYRLERKLIRKITRNEIKIDRLERENRRLMRRLRHR